MCIVSCLSSFQTHAHDHRAQRWYDTYNIPTCFLYHFAAWYATFPAIPSWNNNIKKKNEPAALKTSSILSSLLHPIYPKKTYTIHHYLVTHGTTHTTHTPTQQSIFSTFYFLYIFMYSGFPLLYSEHPVPVHYSEFSL